MKTTLLSRWANERDLYLPTGSDVVSPASPAAFSVFSQGLAKRPSYKNDLIERWNFGSSTSLWKIGSLAKKLKSWSCKRDSFVTAAEVYLHKKIEFGWEVDFAIRSRALRRRAPNCQLHAKSYLRAQDIGAYPVHTSIRADETYKISQSTLS